MKQKSSKRPPLAAKLCDLYGCHGCKNQVTGDPFLTEHSRFWCKKQELSFEGNKAHKAHEDCQFWAFSGDKDLLERAGEETPELPFTERPAGE